ncbi:hypothetical protein C0J52_07257 [Blattella germanica]|nr:hypothetical protein C0J52_07257 [Blattella germanica]
MRCLGFPILLLVAMEMLPFKPIVAVDRNNFKSCQQSSFCRRCRGMQPGQSTYELHLNTLKVEPSSIQADIVNTQQGARFRFQLFALQDGTFRMKINEWSPLKPRYEVQHALVGEPALDKLEVVERTAEFVSIKSGPNTVQVHAIPFRVDLYSGDQLVISANARGLMRFEHLRLKPEHHEGEEKVEGEDTANHDDTASDPGAWEENFKSHHDTKPNGPSAVAMDFSFVGAHHAYGIPEHADSFALKSTKNTDPYRLYNLDVFEYELNNGMALYGSVPVLIAHGYFTWDPIKFSQPTDMVNNLTAKGRKLVTIVDPHIKRDGGYFLHNDAENNNYYVKTKDGKDFEGKMVLAWIFKLFGFNESGSSLVLIFQIFTGKLSWINTMATFEGLLKRSEGKLRPFILTRSHYAGSQRYTAVWTGDNTAEWGHLQITIPMCLSLSVAAIPFCGADVGGFFKNPDAELFTRWYQAGAFVPFFRTHSHIDTKRREPWLFDEQTLLLIREAIRKRYSYLPFWYTLFYEHEQDGAPVMRPLWVEYPTEVATFAIDDEYLLGNKLLVHPVTKQGASDVTVYFPGPNDIWYDTDTYRKVQGGGAVKIPVTMSKNSALGTLYIDDGQSYDYKKQKYLYISLEFKGNKLTSRFIDSLGKVSLETTYNSEAQSLTVRKPAVSMGEEWTIVLQ